MILKDKVAIVTGVSKGIGYQTVKALLDKGVCVYGLGRTPNQVNHKKYKFIRCNVSSFQAVKNAVDQICNLTNGEIHILINNAGLGYFGNLEEISLKHWNEMYGTNVNGIFHCCKMVLPVMKKNQVGHIINISSIAGLEGMPMVSAYASTKWAVRGLSESLFKEVRDDNIKVTCIYPGSTKTDFFVHSPTIKPHDYMLMPEDVATNIIQVLETPDNFHTVNLEIRPLHPKGPKKQL